MRVELINTLEVPIDKFIPILEGELKTIFNCTVENLPENYGRENHWSLLNLLVSGNIDIYQLIYIDGNFWVGSGGAVRYLNGERVYQGGFRGFSSTRRVSNGIGSYSFVHQYNTKQQVERAILLDCTKYILSFNTHNEKLYKITRDYHLPKVFGKHVFEDSVEQIEFNGVPQWLLTMYLK